jgi:vanillate/4-hydroxybenzoate decarboxylase subunit D
MTDADTRSTTDRPAACPRCRSTTVEVVSTSPVANVWTVFTCTTCLYTWRSTEPPENTEPDRYPEAFRLDPGRLPDLAVAPTVPPLRARTETGDPG